MDMLKLLFILLPILMTNAEDQQNQLSLQIAAVDFIAAQSGIKRHVFSQIFLNENVYL